MNNTAAPAADSGGFLGSQNVGGFGYGIGISFGILLLIITITLASYYCTRSTQPSTPPPQFSSQRRRSGNGAISGQPDSDHYVVNVGLDEVTLLSYPIVAYSDVKIKRKDSGSSCCSICLADYKGKDLLRQLPDCGHLFHVKCVDPWLRLNPTCPNCRTTSPIPTPLSTPLAEVVPLTGRRS